MIEQFENIIKKYKALFFDKVWEQTDDGYKLIYNIQGLSDGSNFLPNLKFIFWYDNNKENVKDILTYLLGLNCEYSSIKIRNDIQEVFENVLKYIKNNKTNSQLSDFIINGVNRFNKLLSAEHDPIVGIEYIPPGNSPCIKTIYRFDIETINDTFEIGLEYKTNGDILLTYDMDKYEISIFDDIYIKIINLISK
jgi:hypothetical protein